MSRTNDQDCYLQNLPANLNEYGLNKTLILGKEEYKKVNLRIVRIDLDFNGNDFKEYIVEIRNRVEELNG